MSIALSINCEGLGDVISSIPTIRKISQAYNTPITVFSLYPELFENHPCVSKTLHINDPKEGYEILNTFSHIAGKEHSLEGNVIQFKHSHIDIRQYHALSLGFSLLPKEMETDLYIEEDWEVDFKDYIIIHPTHTWSSRTWSPENWQNLIYKLNQLNIPVIAIGKNTVEHGYGEAYNKKVMEIDIPYGLNLMNHPESSFSKLRGLFKKARCIITMDSGILHLAGTTDIHIIQLGSSINPKLRAPYRKGSQNYKYNYIKGSCDLYCASNLRYNIKEHNSIQGIPPLDNCLENKPTFECHSKIEDVINVVKKLPMTKQKLMYITPHLSTGGMPQYVLRQIKEFKAFFDISIIEYELYSDTYIVQREQIKNLIPPENFFSLGKGTNNKPEVLDIIQQIKPDIIHFQEVPDNFIHESILKKLFNLNNRPYFIVTTHSSYTNPSKLQFIPDKFVLVSEWSKERFSKLTTPCEVWEYPIDNLTPEKEKYQKELGLNPNYKHIINVGLFTQGKNQGELFQLAKELEEYPFYFHFIGNQAENFYDYWGPLMENKPDNCIIWGERDDVYKFIQAADLFFFSSKLELNPLVIKEALSYKLPIFMRKLNTYLDYYDNNFLVTYIDNNLEKTKQLLISHLK
jgi:ADP-heptose:LPS heptosyltransferase